MRITLWTVCLGLLFLLAGGCARNDADFTLLEEQSKSSANVSDDGRADSREQENTRVSVYVCGCIKSPGVYELNSTDRICDAISAAGGVTDKADSQMLNQAEPVTDGMRIYVPSTKETQGADRMTGQSSAGPSQSNSAAGSGQSSSGVNINTASKDELMTLNGIGESKAQSILDYRQENGHFSKIEDIMSIPGIKEGVFEKIKDHITV